MILDTEIWFDSQVLKNRINRFNESKQREKGGISLFEPIGNHPYFHRRNTIPAARELDSLLIIEPMNTCFLSAFRCI